MLTLIERGYSDDSKRHRAQLYLITYALLGVTFLATVAKSGTSTDFFVPLFALSILTGALALVLRTDWFVARPQTHRLQAPRLQTSRHKSRTKTRRQTPPEPRADTNQESERLDRIASLRADRYANQPIASIAAAFPEFEQKNGTGHGSQPASAAPNKNSRPRDPFSSALTDFDNRKKP